MIRKIKKRDGKIVDFNPVKITEAIWKAAQAVGGKDYKKAAELTDKVITILEKELKRGEIPTVEQVQDAVEKILIEDRSCENRESLHSLPETTPGHARNRRFTQRHRCC